MVDENYEAAGPLENAVENAGRNVVQKTRTKYKDYKDSRDLSKLSKELKKKGKDLESLQKDWIATLEGGALRSLVKRPRKIIYGMASHIPGKVGEYFEERGEAVRDPLNVIETGYRDYLDGIEDILIQIGQMAIEERGKLQGAQETYNQAGEEKWVVGELRQTISEELGLQLDGGIADILDDLNDDLEPEQLERKRLGMLDIMKNDIGVRDEMVKLLAVVAKEGGEIYDRALQQYYGFAQMKDKVQMYRDANLEFTGMQALSLDTKDMMVDMINKSTSVAEAAIESISVLEKNMIASKDMQAKVAAARIRLTTKLESVLDGDFQPRAKAKTRASRTQVKV
ncbi:MAG: hypothetical protein L6408_07605 [Nanoarchaeota archaeon]|nr:hypothetical protein [Nanoarchaeota archaeon]